MGYTHYWRRAPEIDAATFAAASLDCAKVCKALPVSLAGGDRTGIPTFEADSVRFNGVDDDGCETFRVNRIETQSPWREGEPDVFTFCKTRQRPYDVCVQCALIVFRHHFGERFRVSSDGNSDEWDGAREACQRVLGYGADFRIGDD